MDKQYPLPDNADDIRDRLGEFDQEQDNPETWTYDNKVALYRVLMSDVEDALHAMVRRSLANLVKHGPLPCPSFSDEHQHIVCYECTDHWPCVRFLEESSSIQFINIVAGNR